MQNSNINDKKEFPLLPGSFHSLDETGGSSEAKIFPSPILPAFKEVSDKLLAHVVGDFIAQESGLEGNHMEETTEYLAAALEQIQKTALLPDIDLTKIFHATKQLKIFSEKLTIIKKMEADKKEEKFIEQEKFCKEIIDAVEDLREGELLFVPGGWSGLISGHAMVHAIRKENNGKYSFYTFNTGGGIDIYHSLHSDKEGMLKYRTVHQLGEIKKEALCNPLFFRALFELRIEPLKMFDENGPNYIYDAILPMLGGVEVKEQGWPKQFQQGQRSGTCAWKCLMAYLRECNPDHYKLIKIYIKYLTIKKYVSSHPLDKENEMNITLLGNAAEKLIRTLNKKEALAALSEEQQREILAYLKDLRQEAQRCREQNFYAATAGELHFDTPCTPYSEIFSLADPLADSTIASEVPLTGKIKYEKSESLLQTPPKLCEITPQNLQEELNQWGEYCERLYKQGNFLSARHYINQFLNALPLPGKRGEDAFWELGLAGSSDEEKELMICSISRLNDLLYRSAFHLKGCNSSDNYSALKSFAIQVKLMEQITGYRQTDLGEEELSIAPAQNGREYELSGSFSSTFNIKDNLNYFGNNDVLRKQFVSLNKKFVNANRSIRAFIADLCKCEEKKQEYIKEGFLEKFQQNLEKKAEPFSIEYTDFAFREALIADFGQRNLLPPFLAALNKQAFLLYLFDSEFYFSQRSQDVLPGEPFDIIFPTVEKIESKGEKESWERPNLPEPFIKGVGAIEKNKKDRHELPEEIEKLTTHLTSGFTNDPAIAALLKIKASAYGQGSNPNIIIDTCIDQKELQSIPLEERRELLLLTQTPAETVVWQTLSYFSRYWDRLEDPNFQTLVEPFVTQHLRDELARTPASLEPILRFICQGIEQFSSPNKLTGLLFCIYFGLKIQQKLQDPENPSATEAPAISSALAAWQDKLNAILNDQGYSEEQKKACSALFGLFSLQKPLCKEGDGAILLAAAIARSTPLPPFLQSSELQRRFQERLLADSEFFLDKLQSDESFTNDLFNGISKTLFGSTSSSWHAREYPVFYNDSATIAINILTGEASCHSLTQTPLPQQIIKDPDYQVIFGKQSFSASVENFNRFSFTYQGQPYRIELEGDKNDRSAIKIEKNIAGSWYRYLPVREASKRLPPPFCENFSHWVALSGPATLIIQDFQENTLFTCDATGKLSAKELPALTLAKTMPSFLDKFEEPSHIATWADAATQLAERIELPRYHLHFAVDHSKQPANAYCQEVPGYFISSQQQLPSLPFLRHFLLLENAGGSKKVLIPSYSLVRKRDDKGQMPLVGESVLKTPQSYITIEFDEKLRPKEISGEAALFLTYLAIAEGKLEAATRYLDLFERSTTLGDYTNDLQLLCSCCAAPCQPKAMALALRAILLIYEKQLFSRLEESSSLETMRYAEVEESIHEYLHNRNNTTTYRLSDYEEKRLLQHIIAHISLSERCFTRLLRLQAGKSLEEKELAPRGNKNFVPHNWNEGRYEAAIHHVKQWAADSISKNDTKEEFWKGSVPLRDGLMRNPEKELLPYFLECCLHIEEYRLSSKREEVLAQLRVMRYAEKAGASLLRDALEKILENPEAFTKELAALQKVLNAWRKMPYAFVLTPPIEALLRCYMEDALKMAPEAHKKPPYSTQRLSLKGAANVREKSAISVGAVEALPLLPNIDVQNGLFIAAEKPLSGRIPPIVAAAHGDLAAAKQIELMNKKLEVFYSKKEKTPPIHYSLNGEKASIETLTDSLRSADSKASGLLASLKQDIVAAANVGNASQEFFDEKRLEGGQKVALKMKDLIILFYKGDLHAFQEACPGLTADGLQEVNKKILLYLQQATRRQQLRRSQQLVSQIQELKNYVEQGIQEPGKVYGERCDAVLLQEDLMQQLANEMKAVPAYELHDHPEYLVLEYYANLRLRPQQVGTLALMLGGSGGSDAKELIAQLTMGSGKTKVLLPLLAMKLADGKRLPILLVPPALLETNKGDLAAMSFKAFGQRPFLLDFHRNSSMEPVDLRFLLQSLQNCIVDKQYVIATPTSLKCIKIKFKELLFSIKNGGEISETQKEQYKLLGKILKLCKKRGYAILDEADAMLEGRRSEVNFPIGTSSAVSDERRTVCRLLLSSLLEGDGRGIARLWENKQADIKEPQRKELQEIFINNVITHLSIDSSLHEGVRKYLQSEPSADLRDPRLQGAVSLLKQAKEVATTLLPLVLKKSANEHYGRSHTSPTRYAVPYLANDTPDERSEFGNIDEVVLYTSFLYAQEGLKDYDVDYLIQQMQRKVRLQGRAEQCLLTDTPAYKECRELFEIKNIFDISSDEKKGAASAVQKNQKALFYWLENFAFPDMKSYSQKLSAQSLDLIDLFAHVQGFTGTPWNRATYHDRLNHPELESLVDHPEDEIAIVDTIWRKVEGAESGGRGSVYQLDDNTPIGYLEEMLKIPDIQVLLDVGALLKGITNKKVAKKIRKQLETQEGSQLKGTLYFDSENKIVIHLDGNEPVAIDALAIAERFSYYDQYHTRGIDIKQRPRAKALLTFSHGTVEDLTQGAMRMRQLMSSQSLSLVVPKSAADKICSEGETLNFSTILRAAVTNRAKRLGEDLLYSTKQKLRYLATNPLDDLLLTLPDMAEAAALLKAFEPLLTDISSDEPSEKVLKEIPTLQMLESLRMQQIEEVEKLFSAAFQDQQLSQRVLGLLLPLQKEILEKMRSLPMPEATTLPEKQPEHDKDSSRLNSRVEIEKEVEINKQSQKAKQQAAECHPWLKSNTPVQQPDFLRPDCDNHNKHAAPQVIKLQQVFHSAEALKHFDGIFDEGLQTTKQFVITAREQSQWAFVPECQKRCFQLVMVKEEGKIRGIMMDPIEAGLLRRCLPTEEQKALAEADRKICVSAFDPKYSYLLEFNSDQEILRMKERARQLAEHEEIKTYQHNVQFIDLVNGFTHTLGVPFSEEDEKQVIELSAQAKFYNGYLTYSPDEWKYLVEWISKSERKEQMKELFEMSLLSQPGEYKFYHGTPIHKLLTAS